MKLYVLASLACAFILFAGPTSLRAATSSLEFATQSVFLSQATAQEGASIRVYASIVNQSGSAMDGRVVFRDAGKEIGSVSVSLAAGEARIASISWQPEKGAHTVTAALLNESGETLSSSNSSNAPKITVTAAPKQEQQVAAAVESSDKIEKAITGMVPQAETVTQPVFKTLDSARSSITDVLDSQLAKTKPKLPTGSSVSSTTKSSPEGVAAWIISVLWTLYYYLLTILRFVISSAFWFYPIFAFLIVWGLYKLYRKMTEPRFTY